MASDDRSDVDAYTYFGNVLGIGSLCGLVALALGRTTRGYNDGEIILFCLMCAWAIGTGLSMAGARVSGKSPWKVFTIYLLAGIVTFLATATAFTTHQY